MSKKIDIRFWTTELALFVCFAFTGWIYELVVCIFKDNELMNRGFLYGPWLPIYGFGGILLYHTIYLHWHKGQPASWKNSKWTTFFVVSFAATGVELISTYVLDALHMDFTTLWTYSDYHFNFQSRIALIPAVQFGLLGVVMIHFAVPKIEKFVYDQDRHMLQYVVLVLFVLDLLIHLRTGSTYTDVPLLKL